MPLILVDGQIEQAGRLNIGNFEHIVATSTTITISNSFVRLTSPSMQNVDTILGGNQGDVLILFGNNVGLRRRNNGNLELRSNTLLNNNRSTMLVCVGPFWVQPGGN